MTQRIATFRLRRYNSYVPAAQYGNDVIHSAPYLVNYGTPAVAAAANVLSAQSIAVATNTITAGVALLSDTADNNFGRTLQVVASGAATSTVTVTGKDYLGQPVQELLTLNGATPVQGVKAFYWIDSVAWGATAATTINLGWGAKFGVPYRATNFISERANGAAAAAGTLVTASTVDPQTNVTLDPRGVYTPSTTPNGTTLIEVFFVFTPALNAAGNGGLYGLKHFGG